MRPTAIKPGRFNVWGTVIAVAILAVGISGILFYMLAYTFMNIGAFAILVLAGKKGEENLTLEGFSGFGFKRPFLGVGKEPFMERRQLLG